MPRMKKTPIFLLNHARIIDRPPLRRPSSEPSHSLRRRHDYGLAPDHGRSLGVVAGRSQGRSRRGLAEKMASADIQTTRNLKRWMAGGECENGRGVNRSSAEAVPAKDQVHREYCSSHKGGEEDEHGRTDIVEELKQDNLPDDLQRRKICQSPGTRRAPPRGHEPE
ncbi:hypothetical protein T310_2034 [Rasamsonia emersonii CBS 393.64]|uniref:Uncharacterized protein n=1 Tax=Rasamsonia emersonii (strain ATCC 16479 / CBS 393.64 / IMI 116815) TaxID=1408163 RepID=A0A0F4Z088_RASE3|nr:hypothetical protein T310_2034 [Rasamsonia emersonii CBS 393.64]KKA23942.1 hypothetical protein T310_2034 [Rasamsonia emersonii CBS 393.64]